VLVGFQALHVVHIHGPTLVFAHEVHTVFDMAQAALAQHVEFVKAPLFGRIHVEMGDREALGHQLQRRGLVQRRFGNDDPAGMNRQVVGKVHQLFAEVEDVFGPGV
jgi:hypothetical protein